MAAKNIATMTVKMGYDEEDMSYYGRLDGELICVSVGEYHAALDDELFGLLRFDGRDEETYNYQPYVRLSRCRYVRASQIRL